MKIVFCATHATGMQLIRILMVLCRILVAQRVETSLGDGLLLALIRLPLNLSMSTMKEK